MKPTIDWHSEATSRWWKLRRGQRNEMMRIEVLPSPKRPRHQYNGKLGFWKSNLVHSLTNGYLQNDVEARRSGYAALDTWQPPVNSYNL